MATKNYMINDKWLDLDKQNIVELQSVDGVLDSLKVNGSEIETPSGKITITENGTDIDIAQYALADVNVEGGGSSWETVFEGSVTTEQKAQGMTYAVGDIPNIAEITANTIRVTFNGTVYTCEKNADGDYGAPYDVDLDDYDWSEYPFNIYYNILTQEETLHTQTAGTYTLKIEEEQSGGSSDFSTAKMTIANMEDGNVDVYAPIVEDNMTKTTQSLPEGEYDIILYKGKARVRIDIVPEYFTISGDITLDDDSYIVEGDFSITYNA